MLPNYDDRLTQDSPSIQAIANGQLQFDPGAIFSESFRLFSKDPGILIGMTVVSFFMSFAPAIIPFVGMVGVYIMIPTLFAGFLITFRDLDTSKITIFSRLFDGFKNLANTALVYFVTSMIVGVLPFVLGLIFLGSSIFDLIQLSASAGSDPDKVIEIFQQLSSKILLLYAVLIPYYFIFGLTPMIATTIGAFNPKMDFGTILKSALLISIKHPGKIALSTLLITLIYLMGVVALCLGLLAALPVIAAFFYLIYKHSLQPGSTQSDRLFHADDTLDSGLV